MGFRELLGLYRVYGGIAVGAKDMERAIAWYGTVFGLVAARHREGQLEIPLGYAPHSGEDVPVVVLLAIPEGKDKAEVERHPVLFTKRLERVHANLIDKGVSPGPIQNDSGGNRFFEFQDSEGNKIEICLEPGS